MEYMLASLTGAIIGADVALYRSTSIDGKEISLEEKKLIQFFEDNKYNEVTG